MMTDWWTISENYVLGCARVGPGCENCFAIRDVLRELHPEHRGLAIMTDDGPDWTGVVRVFPERLAKLHAHLAKAKSKQYVIITLHGDLFFKTSDDEIRAVFDLARAHPEHVIMSLTKRPEAQRRFCDRYEPPENVWLGVSVEDQQTADARLPILRETKVAVPFVSFEPVLGPIVAPWMPKWAIVGGESGPGAREMRSEWARALRDQCCDAGTALWFKQWGDIRYGLRVGRKHAGCALDGQVWLQRPDGTEAVAA